jgi:hypothetical protein
MRQICFDLAPPGAIWYFGDDNGSAMMRVLISLPPEQFGIVSVDNIPIGVVF